MPNPQIIIDPSKRPKDGPDGNTQVDGTVVHVNERAAGKAEIESQMAELVRQEPSGANLRTHRGNMIRTEQFDKAYPEYHHRYVNIRDPEKLAARIREGYVEVARPSSGEKNDPTAYGRRLGDEYVLMRIPRARYDLRMKEQSDLTRSRESAHVTEVSNVAEQVLAELRRQGLNVSTSRLLDVG